MHEDAVVAVFSTLEEARRAVARLDKVGWNSGVSLITRGGESELDATSLVDQSDQMEKSAAIGAAAGAAIGLLASSALLIIPGLGPVLFVGAMASGITGGLVGGLVGAMSGWGVKEDHVREYERDLRSGKSLVMVTGDPLRLAEVQALMEDSEADRVVLHAEAADVPVDK